MSKVSLAGNASGTGIFTIASPNSNTDRTLTLPDATGTVALQGGTGVGKILQVVQGTVDTAPIDISSSTPTSLVNLSITPSSSSSRIIITGYVGDIVCNSSARASMAIYRNGSSIRQYSAELGRGGQIWQVAQVVYVDSPATTSAITYALYGWNSVGGTGNVRFSDSSMPRIIIAMEVAA